MGSTQSQIVCKKCKFEHCSEEYYYKTGEAFVFCDRCGYSFSAFMKHDPAYGQRMKRQAEELIKAGKIDEALEVTGNRGWTRSCMVDGVYKTDIPISEWSDEDKIKTIMDTSWNRYHMKDKDGNYVWDIQSSGGFGAYHHQKKSGGGVGGHFRAKWSAKKTIRQMIKAIKSPKRKNEIILYTKKIKGKWFIFNARTSESVEIPDNLHFNIWMRIQHGDFKNYKICDACKGQGGISIPNEIPDTTKWQTCEVCKGEGLI